MFPIFSRARVEWGFFTRKGLDVGLRKNERVVNLQKGHLSLRILLGAVFWAYRDEWIIYDLMEVKQKMGNILNIALFIRY